MHRLHSLTWAAAGIGRHRRRIDGRRRNRVCRRPGGARWRRTRGEVVSKHRLSERYRCHNAGPRFSLGALASCSMGSRNRLSDFPNAGTLLFQEVEHPRRLNTFPSDSLQGPAGMLTGKVGTSSGQFSQGEAMAPLAESMQWPRNQFGAPVLFTITAPGAAASWCYNASPRPVSSLQREELSPGRCCSGNAPSVGQTSSEPLLNLQMVPMFPVGEYEDRQCPVQQ